MVLLGFCGAYLDGIAVERFELRGILRGVFRGWRHVLCGVLFLSLAVPASGLARRFPFGALTQLRSPENCFSSAPSFGCGSVARGVNIGTGSVVVTPDGRNVYVGSEADGSVLEFARDRRGRLRQLPAPYFCVGGAASGTLCPHQALGLRAPGEIVVSPDGRNVYVASNGGDSLVEFARGRGGALRQLSGINACIGMSAPPDAGGLPCPAKAPGLNEPDGMVISPDGRDLYVLGRYASTLDVFARRRGGSLRFVQCIQERGLANRYSGTSGCLASAAGLSDPAQVVVSPDGRDVYVSSPDSRSVATFARRGSGRLGEVGCLGQNGSECGGLSVDLDGASGLASSPDGRSVYLGARYVLLPLRRGRRGRLRTFGGRARCIGAADSGCPEQGPGLEWDDSLAVSRDGRNVYVAAYSLDAITALVRQKDGSLRQIPGRFDCLSPYPYSGCHGTAVGIWSPAAVALSPDGRSVYVTGSESDALALFARHAP